MERDDAGRPVPKKLAASFRAKLHLQEWIELMREMPRLLKEQLRDSGIDNLDTERVERESEKLADLVEEHLPYALCLCKGLTACPHCGGKGWLSQGEAFLVSATHKLPKDEAWLKEVKDTFKLGSRVKSTLVVNWSMSEARSYVVSALKQWLVSPGWLDGERVRFRSRTSRPAASSRRKAKSPPGPRS